MLSAFGLLLLLLPFAAGNFHRSGDGAFPNISSLRGGLRISRYLQDGEYERVTTWPGFCAIETSVDWGEMDVTLREVWLEGEKRKLQLIYEGGTLSDCFEERIEYVRGEGGGDDDVAVAEECLTKVNWKEGLRENQAENGGSRKDSNNKGRVEVLSVEDSSPLQKVVDWFVSADDIRDRCSRVRNRTRNQVLARLQGQSRIRRGILPEFLFAPGTKWCGPTQLASRYNELGAFDQLDRCCRRHDHCHRAIPPMTQRYALYNHMPFTLSHCGCDQRKYEAPHPGAVQGKSKRKRRRGRGRGRGWGRKRGKRDLLLIPGTQWCGRGHRATKYTNLGGFGVADACCRRHDTTCPFFIPAFETKYNFFNWGVSTLMHCACDERFRTCLKLAGTSSANFVGKLFFNVVQTKCFVLKPQKTCQRRSWWGKCEHHEYRKQAHLRDNVPY